MGDVVKMKKVLFLIPTLTGGGAEKVLVNLVNNINKEKYSITVMTLFNIGENIKYLNRDVEYKYFLQKRFRGNKYFFKFFSPSLLYKLIIKDEYEVVISYLAGPTTRIVAGCKNKNVKLINWVHNEFHSVKKLSTSYRSVNETIDCYNKYHSTVFVAETAKQAFEKILPEYNGSYKVLYNTVETGQIIKKSEEPVIDIIFNKNTINIISVGRFAKQKGYERLLEIINYLVTKDKLNIHLYLLGKGELEEKYKKIISTYNLSKHVTLLGYKDNPYKYVKKADLFVCSSYHEGFSTAVTEALIVGTPVISTRCSGMTELLGENDEYGIIVENDVESLYEGLKSLLKEKEELYKLKEVANKRGIYFNTESTVNKVEQFLGNL